MNKKNLGIAGAVLLVVCCLGGIGLNRAERNTEEAVLQNMQAFGINCEAAKYSVISKKLTLTNLDYNLSTFGFPQQGTIAVAEVIGFNPDCLNPREKTLPKVADSINLKGISFNYQQFVPGNSAAELQMNSTGTVSHVQILGWYQNLGALAQAYQQGFSSEAFWTEVYRNRLGAISYSDYLITVDMPPAVSPIEYSIGSMKLLGNAGAKDANPEAGRLVSYVVDDMRVTLPYFAEVQIDRCEINDFLLPSPKGMAILMENMTKIVAAMENPGANDYDDQIFQNLLSFLVDEYGKHPMFSKISFQNFRIQYDDAMDLDEVSMQKLELTHGMEDFIKFGINIEKFVGFATQLPERERNVLNAYAPDNQSLDLKLDIALRSAAAGASKASLGSGFADLGRGNVTADVLFDSDWESLADIFSEGLSDPEDLLLESFTATYSDNGFLALMLSFYAQDSKISFNRALTDLQIELDRSSRQLGEFGNKIEDAVKIMLDKPGTISLTLVPDEPVDLPSLPLLIMFGGEGIAVKLDATPGEKPLLDYVPEALRSGQGNSGKSIN